MSNKTIIVAIIVGLLGFGTLWIIQDQKEESLRLSQEIELLKQQQGNNTDNQQVTTPNAEEPSIVDAIEELDIMRELSNLEAIAKVKPAIVYVETPYGSGSGMIIDSSGFILTNAHVVRESTQVIVYLASGVSFPVTALSISDEMHDIAVLRIDAKNLPAVNFADSDQTQQGEDVFTFGYPFGIKGEVSFKEGTISRRFQQGGVAYLETSAEVHPGNSGGPLVNRYGEVIGVVTGKLGQSIQGILLGESIKFAIPINSVKGIISALSSNMKLLTETTGVCTVFKAKGFVTLYNETTETQRLIASTRLVSQAGLLFRIDEDVILPLGSTSKPGEVRVSVSASEIGAQYTIGPSNFSIPGLAGSPLYTQIYARSFGNMTCF